MSGIEVVRAAALPPADSTAGIARAQAFDARDISVGRSRIPHGVASGWHHHGERHLYGFLVSGRLRLEYGPDGMLVTDLRRGDFFHIPPRLVHRDVNPSPADDSLVMSVLAGHGRTVVNVNGPDRS